MTPSVLKASACKFDSIISSVLKPIKAELKPVLLQTCFNCLNHNSHSSFRNTAYKNTQLYLCWITYGKNAGHTPLSKFAL